MRLQKSIISSGPWLQANQKSPMYTVMRCMFKCFFSVVLSVTSSNPIFSSVFFFYGLPSSVKNNAFNASNFFNYYYCYTVNNFSFTHFPLILFYILVIDIQCEKKKLLTFPSFKLRLGYMLSVNEQYFYCFTYIYLLLGKK